MNRLKSPATNWVVKLGNLHNLFSSLDVYYSQALQIPLEIVSEGVDLTEIAKKADRGSTIKLIHLVLFAAIRCQQHQVYLGKIMSMSEDSQTVLMFAIREFLAKTKDYVPSTDEAKILKKENTKLKFETRKLLYVMEEIQHEVISLVKRTEELQADRDRQSSRAEEAEAALSRTRAANTDTAENSAFALALENHVQAKEAMIADLNNQIAEMKKFHAKEISVQRDENDYLNEQLIHTKDLENTVEKYREKLEEMQSTKKMNAELQKINEGIQLKLAKYEEDIASLTGWKQSLALMKDQLKFEKERSAKLAVTVEEKERLLKQTIKMKGEIEEKLQFVDSKMRELNTENERLRFHFEESKDESDPNSISRAFTDVFEARIQELETENTRIRALAGTEGMMQHLNEQLDSVLLSKATLEEKLRTVLSDKQLLSAELHELKGILQRTEIEGNSKVADLTQDVETRTQQTAILTTKLQEYERDKVKFEATLRENEALKSENNQHMRDLKAVYAEKDAANQRYIQCKEELILAKATVTDLQTQIRRSEQDCKRIADQLAQAHVAEGELRKEMEMMKTRPGGSIADLGEKLKLLEAEKNVMQLNGEITEMRHVNKDKDERIRGLTAELENLKEEIKQRLKRQELELQSLHEAEIQELQQQTKEAHDESEFCKRHKDDTTRQHTKEEKLMAMVLLETGLMFHRFKFSQDRIMKTQQLNSG